MCGFIGVCGPEGVDVASDIYEGLLAVQHRGQDAAGITTFTNRFHTRKDSGLVVEIFRNKDMLRLRGSLGLGHVRYPTAGPTSSQQDEINETQPHHLNFPFDIAVAYNGNVVNSEELIERYFSKTPTRLNSCCDTELILMVFANALKEYDVDSITQDDIAKAVKTVLEEVKGAYSVVILIPHVGFVAFRDSYGIKPICLGKKITDQGEFYAVVSESVVLDVNGYTLVRDLKPGEMLFIDNERQVHFEIIEQKEHKPCIFEWVYFSRPDSLLDNISVYKTRRRLGEALAKQWIDTGSPLPDVVIPIPDSSREAAMMIAEFLKVPYREGLVKNRYVGRTFIMPTQTARSGAIRRKLNPIQLEFRNKKVLLVDDSIIRGTTSKRIVEMIRNAGAQEVYFGVTSPPIIAPCPYGIDMASRREFVANGRTTDEVADILGIDYLMYLDIKSMNDSASAGNPDLKQFCNACFTGEYPTEGITTDQLDVIESGRNVYNSDRTLV